jgi:hypothetical protein
MATPLRLIPLLEQFDWARKRLHDRLAGPAGDSGAEAWRAVLVSADDAALDMVGRSTYPYGSDPEDPFIDSVWWMNQELLHHGAEIALLRDLYRARNG